MTALAALLLSVGALLAVAVLSLVAGQVRHASEIVYSACLALSAVGLVAALTHLIAVAAPAEIVLPLGLPWIGAHFRLDALSAFFVALVSLSSSAASLYAVGHGREEPAPGRVLPFYPVFLAGMNLVVLAGDAFTFLSSWEVMSLASCALVLAHHREEENAHAGYVYLVMASFSALTLLLAFGFMAGPDGAYAFDSIRARMATASSTSLVLVLALIGAGSKAGLAPLHVWLPLAHPAAPSHVSALMSGAMTKVAVYAFVRIVFDLIGPPAWWWGAFVLAVGGMTAALGVLHALMQRDLKRLLAYSTVENIGIIFIGLGLALAFQAYGIGSAAALALTAGLLHAFNHSAFKSLLFLGAGAVLSKTGARDMERLGGLIHRMPQTAFLFLVGCAAISALPPLNGFVSEWLTLQAILLSPQLPSWGLKLLAPAVGALLALSAALAAACFIKAYGVTFLGRPRTPAAEAAHETDRFSLVAMSLLAAVCFIAGIVPSLFIDALAPVAQSLVGNRMPGQIGLAWLTVVPIAESRSSYNGMLVFLFVAASGCLAAWVIHRFASHAIRRGPAWDCGFPELSPATQYTAASFSQPIRRVYGSYVFRAREQVDMPSPGELRPAQIQVELHDLAWDWLYTPITRAVSYVADRLNPLQFRTIRQYLSFVFFALIVLLTGLAVWS